MSGPDRLRVVAANETPIKPALRVTTFTFVDTDTTQLIYRDGQMIDAMTCADALIAMMTGGFEKAEKRANELASTPNGLR